MNTIFTVLIYSKRGRFFPQISITSHIDIFGKRFDFLFIAYLSSILILIGSILGALASSFIGRPEKAIVNVEAAAFIFWIPIIEEMVFRVAIGKVFRNYGGDLLGGYFSALCFAFIHTMPTLGKVVSLNAGIPLGPMLLGLCCEIIYVKTGKIIPAIVFHGCCNATVPIFMLIDNRWLSFLSYLYS
ncbi:MAG: CPBP family intramembrane metalloprotease [Oligoflexales bacterium]|nr:CPBP family intramembrane metalloprotease [Oligoflexales bacterium]